MKKLPIILLAFATLAMVACKKSKSSSSEPVDPGDEPVFVSLIDVSDYELSDWDNVPAEYLTVIDCNSDCSMWQALKQVKVYADKVYLNLVVEFVADSFPDRTLIPFHIYLNADGNNKTGGYGGDHVEFMDGNAEYNLEGFLYENNAAVKYNPAVFQWWGVMGGGITDQVDTDGWYWTDPATAPHNADDGWGALVPTASLPIGESQKIAANIFEIQLLRELITSDWANEFGIGFDIQRVEGAVGSASASWTSIGVLPNMEDDVVTGNTQRARKAKIKIDPNMYTK